MELLTKVCPICNQILALTSFYKRGSRLHKDGSPYYQHGCKQCRRAATKAWQQANPERTKAIGHKAVAKYHQLHKEAIRERRKANRQANPEHYRELWRARYQRIKQQRVINQMEVAA